MTTVIFVVSLLLMFVKNCYQVFGTTAAYNANDWLSKYDEYRKIIEENTEITNEDNLTPEIRLHLITPRSKLWNANTKDSPFKDSPFFAFYWAGGQGLTRYILDHPEIVRGQRVLDLGSGCGASAIAAARCGAASVTANDIDPLTCVGIDMNSELNGININITKENLISKKKDFSNWECIFIGDLLYEFNDMKTLVVMLRKACLQGKHVFIGEPCGIFRAYTMTNELKQVAQYTLPAAAGDMLGACVMIDMNANINGVKLNITSTNLIKHSNLSNWDTILVSGVWYTYEEVSLLVLRLRAAFQQGKPVFVGDPSGTIKYFAKEKEFKTVAEYVLSDYTYKLLGFRGTEVLEFQYYMTKEEQCIEKYKHLINELNMSLFW